MGGAAEEQKTEWLAGENKEQTKHMAKEEQEEQGSAAITPSREGECRFAPSTREKQHMVEADLQICCHVAGGLTHHSLPGYLRPVLQPLHRGPVEGHCRRLVGVREQRLEALHVCLQLCGHMHKEAEEEGRRQTASELHHATCNAMRLRIAQH